jgi:hypothetical protein
MSLPEKDKTPEEPSLPIARKHLSLEIPPVTPSPKKVDVNGYRFITDNSFMDERKPSSTTVPVTILNLKTQTNYLRNLATADGKFLTLFDRVQLLSICF